MGENLRNKLLAVSMVTSAGLMGCSPSAPSVEAVLQCVADDHATEKEMTLSRVTCADHMLLEETSAGAHRTIGNDSIVFSTKVTRYAIDDFDIGSTVARACGISGLTGPDVSLHETITTSNEVTFERWSDGWRCASVERGAIEARTPSGYEIQFEHETATGGRVTEFDLIGKKTVVVFGSAANPDLTPTRLAEIAAQAEGLGGPSLRPVLLFVEIDNDVDLSLAASMSDSFGSAMEVFAIKPDRTEAQRLLSKWNIRSASSSMLGTMMEHFNTAVAFLDETGTLVGSIAPRRYGDNVGPEIRAFLSGG